jgi:hypothetical protein
VSVTGVEGMPLDPPELAPAAVDDGLEFDFELLEQAATDAIAVSATVAINIFLCNCPPRLGRPHGAGMLRGARSRAPDNGGYEPAVGGCRRL